MKKTTQWFILEINSRQNSQDIIFTTKKPQLMLWSLLLLKMYAYFIKTYWFYKTHLIQAAY